jgi:hypothetical protein
MTSPSSSLDCSICYEEIKNISHACQLKASCGHEFCRACLTSWIESCETTASSKPPNKATCPICRDPINEWDVDRIVGHAFRPPKPIIPPSDEADDLFRLWLEEEGARSCPQCGMWIIRSYGCNHMRCRCGAAFCYSCGNGLPSSACSCEDVGEDYPVFTDDDLRRFAYILFLDSLYLEARDREERIYWAMMEDFWHKNQAGGKASLRQKGNSRNHQHSKQRKKREEGKNGRGYHRPSQKRSQRATIVNAVD